MPHLELDLDVPVGAERLRDALVDFSPERPDIWPGLARHLYEVREVGDTWALVKEGTKTALGDFWSVERYEWSEPRLVRWTVVESNFCRAGDYVSTRFDAGTEEACRVHLTWERNATTFKGRLAMRIVWLTHGKPVTASLVGGAKRIAAQGRGGGPGA